MMLLILCGSEDKSWRSLNVVLLRKWFAGDVDLHRHHVLVHECDNAFVWIRDCIHLLATQSQLVEEVDQDQRAIACRLRFCLIQAVYPSNRFHVVAYLSARRVSCLYGIA